MPSEKNGSGKPVLPIKKASRILCSWLFCVSANKRLEPTQCTGQSSELEWPGHPDPFWHPNEECNHTDRADDKHNPVTVGVIDVFFVLFHDVHFIIDVQK